MNRLTRSSIAFAALTLAGIFSFTSKASANDTTSVTVSATVPASCSFDAASLIPGTLGQDFANKTLDSTYTGGTIPGSAGSVDLTCNNVGSTLSVTNVGFVESNTTATTNRTSTLVTVTHNDGTITNNGTTTSPPITITTVGTPVNVKVDAKAVYSKDLLAGTYTFTVDLAANP